MGMPNINPRQMEQMMRKMGIQQEDIDASQVIIICPDKKIVIDHPSVQKVNMMGQKNYQISGEEHIESIDTAPEISEDDIKTVMEQTDSTREEAKDALEEYEGNIAQAIMSLKSE